MCILLRFTFFTKEEKNPNFFTGPAANGAINLFS